MKGMGNGLPRPPPPPPPHTHNPSAPGAASTLGSPRSTRRRWLGSVSGRVFPLASPLKCVDLQPQLVAVEVPSNFVPEYRAFYWTSELPVLIWMELMNVKQQK